jgi:hypothetical protein
MPNVSMIVLGMVTVTMGSVLVKRDGQEPIARCMTAQLMLKGAQDMVNAEAQCVCAMLVMVVPTVHQLPPTALTTAKGMGHV